MNSDFNVAVHALVYLDHKACTLSSEELAENICTNAARVRKVMSKLRKDELVSSAEGAVGGYALARPGSDIHLDEVASAIGGSFVTCAWRSGNADMECLVASGMGKVMDDIYADLDRQCMDRMHETTIGSITARLFGEETPPEASAKSAASTATAAAASETSTATAAATAASTASSASETSDTNRKKAS